ncbi:MAG TPA: TonB-dependent receptor [Sphingobium sp.]|uniref:TonB-dependent receptor n=1 Tax=Sphingobium sp. TaxID=1912891 RepID=UPI002ED1AEA3
MGFSIQIMLRGAVAVSALATASMAAAQAPEEQFGGDIIVTAQKRSESIQTVPLSLTVLTQENLERRGVQSIYDLSRIAPSLAVTSSGPGENNLIIRGISSIAGSAATVGYYLDDTPIAASSNAALLSTRGVIDPSALDVARIEVLRGPQGTLYGSSSMGGTVRYITNQPNLDKVEGRVKADLSGTEHGGFNWNLNGVINLPIVKDMVALRVAGYVRRDDGYIDRYSIDPNNYLAAAPGAQRQNNVNTYETHGFRAALLIKPNDTLTITPSFLYQYSKLGTPFTFDATSSTDLSNPIQIRDIDETNTQKSWIANVAIKQEIGDTLELVSSTSYYHREVNLIDDSSKVIPYFFGTPTVEPVAMYGSYTNKEFTQELRLSSNFKGPFQFIFGGYYHNVTAPLTSGIPFPSGYAYRNTAPFNGFSTIYAGSRNARLQEYAAFGELTYKLTDTLTARVGARAFLVDQKFYQSGDGLLNGGFSDVFNTSHDSGVTPKVSLNWQATPTKMIYATASKGYRPGGPNNPAPASVCGSEVAGLGLSQGQLTAYNPDNLWNYEVGAKTSWLDKRLTVNGSVFYIDWSKVQQQIVLQCGFNITANFGKAVSKGGELEIEFRPIKQITLGGGFGYTDSTLSNDVPGTPAKAGDQLQYVPKWTGNASAEYADDITASLKGFVRADWTYLGPASFLYDKTSPFYRRDGFSIFNARVGLNPIRGPWEASIYVNNLLDKRGATDLPVAISADLPTTRRVALNQPRTVGVSLGYRF